MQQSRKSSCSEGHDFFVKHGLLVCWRALLLFVSTWSQICASMLVFTVRLITVGTQILAQAYLDSIDPYQQKNNRLLQCLMSPLIRDTCSDPGELIVRRAVFSNTTHSLQLWAAEKFEIEKSNFLSIKRPCKNEEYEIHATLLNCWQCAIQTF